MISFRLSCQNDHQFDAWFSNSETFEMQNAAGQISCPVCGSPDISKALMTPSVATSRKKRVQSVDTAQDRPVPVAANAPVPDEMLAMMRRIRDQVTENADYVGKEFAEEARKIHYGEREERGIYGEASLDEVKNLHEEGIDILPLPVLPEDRN